MIHYIVAIITEWQEFVKRLVSVNRTPFGIHLHMNFIDHVYLIEV